MEFAISSRESKKAQQRWEKLKNKRMKAESEILSEGNEDDNEDKTVCILAFPVNPHQRTHRALGVGANHVLSKGWRSTELLDKR